MRCLSTITAGLHVPHTVHASEPQWEASFHSQRPYLLILLPPCCVALPRSFTYLLTLHHCLKRKKSHISRRLMSHTATEWRWKETAANGPLKLCWVRKEPRLCGGGSASNHWHTVTPDDCGLGQLLNQLCFGRELLQTDAELKMLPSWQSCGSVITVNLHVPLQASLFPVEKQQFRHGRTVAPLWHEAFSFSFFFFNQVPFQFLFLPFVFVTHACFTFLFKSFSLLLLLCIFVVFFISLVWFAWCFFTWRHFFFHKPPFFYDSLKYWTYSLLQQTYLV